MEFQIVKTEDKVRGRLYYVNVAGKEIDLMMTWHALLPSAERYFRGGGKYADKILS